MNERRVGWRITDRRSGPTVIHSWDLGLRGEVSDGQREVLEVIIHTRRAKKYRTYEGEDGRPATLDMIREVCNPEGLERMLDDLTAKGYLTFRHPRKWENGRRVEDTALPVGYDLAFGQMSFPVTYILDPEGISPTIVPTDVRHMGLIVRV